MASPLFHGGVFVQHDRDDALRYAAWAAESPSTSKYIHFNLFCDASKGPRFDSGGNAVVFRSWLPTAEGENTTRQVYQSAWPIYPLYDHRLGEILSVSECLHVASQELERHANSPMLAGKTVVVRIFNDNQRNLGFIQGTEVFDVGLFTMAAPVLRSILQQSKTIHQHGVDVRLELHWMPGHKHKIKPHALADKLASAARRSRRALTTIPPRYWVGPEEGPMFQSLKAELQRATRDASWYMPGPLGQFPRRPRPIPAFPEIGPPGSIWTAVTDDGVLVAYANTALAKYIEPAPGCATARLHEEKARWSQETAGFNLG